MAGAGVAAVLGAALLWSLTGPFARSVYAAGLPPEHAGAWRAGVAFAALLVWAALRRQPLSAPPGVRWLLVAGGVVGIGAFYLLVFWSFKLNRLAVAAILLYTAPVFLAVADAAAGEAALGPRRLAALALALVGVYLVSGGDGPAPNGLGIAAGLGSGLAYAAYTWLARRAVAEAGIVPAMAWTLGIGSLVLLGATAAVPAPPAAYTPALVLLLVAGGLGLTLAPYALYAYALRGLAAGDANALAAVEPVLATLWGWWLWGETPDARRALGALLVVAAVAALERERRGRRGSGEGEERGREGPLVERRRPEVRAVDR